MDRPECTHCHSTAYFIFLGAEPTPLCVKCASKFINALPELENYINKQLEKQNG